MLRVGWTGARGSVFRLALITGFWSVLTLGFYRFWMKTRLRRYFWSSIRPGGHPLEYVGDPWEKLLGFFIAVVILTFYIGIVNLLLMFVSFSLFDGNFAGYLASVAGVVPLWFYARYRARRYVLGRTRWRGVRFALEPGAWGYALRALGHWALTLFSAGILWPRMTFYLEKYRTDRTWFGSARLHQGGTWLMLYRAAIPLGVTLASTALWALWISVLDPILPALSVGWQDVLTNVRITTSALADLQIVSPWRLWLLFPIFFGLIYSLIHYAYVSRRIMACHKTADGIAFASALRPLRIASILTFGNILAYFILSIGVALIMVLMVPLIGFEVLQDMAGIEEDLVFDLPRWFSIGGAVLLYFGIFLLWSVMHATFVTFPLMRHMAETLTLPQAEGLLRISQRDRDDFAEAEGFSEALDLGAAI